MKPHSAQEYADWKDSLFSRARILIAEDPESFALAGNLLAQTFSNEFIWEMDADNPESPRLGWDPERILITRICSARSAAIGQSEEHLVAKLDFRFTGKITERLRAARQSILAILLAADPDANDYITADICELALLQFESTEPQILGRIWVPWNWNEEDQYLCPGTRCHTCPTPEALHTLESALKLVEQRVVSIKNDVKAQKTISNHTKKARWFTRVTKGLLTGDTLRKAVTRKALINSTQSTPNGEWTHSVNEVCEAYPQHELRIRKAIELEQ